MAEPAPQPDPGEAAEAAMLQALTEVIRTAASPEVRAAQVMLLQRLVVEGSVIPSRIPAPRNVTEIGGYLNLLHELGLPDMQKQVLSATLGVAGPSVLSDLVLEPPPLPLVPVSDNVPAGNGVALTVAVRADFAEPLRKALTALHAAGGRLPLWSPPAVLPPRLAGVPATAGDLLSALGRRLLVAPTAVLVDPTTDPVILGHTAADPAGAVRLAVRVAAGTPGIDSGDWTALRRDSGTGAVTEEALGKIDVVPLDAVLAPSGFRPARSTAAPAAVDDYAWAELTDTEGLLPHVTRLGQELALAHPSSAILASAFATRLGDVWDGSTFSAPS